MVGKKHDVMYFINHLLTKASQQRASDIHIEPQATHVRIRQRIDGFLLETDQIAKAFANALISHIKITSQLDIGEKRMPQDGAMRWEEQDVRLDVRVSTLPTAHGEKVVLRLLKNEQQAYQLDDLGMPPAERDRTELLLRRGSGLVIVSGPTGSGKTTTLYAMIQALNRTEANIVTLEDPIELKLHGVNQVQIRPKAGLTFARGLRSVLRQDPDIIMIGEIRDEETANIAIGAALSGHLVLSSLHTSDAIRAVPRLVDMGIAPYRVAAALSGVIAQRLVRLVCDQCGGERCPVCQHTGYHGRTGAFEVIGMDEDLEQLIAKGASLADMRALLREQGVRGLKEAVKALVDQNRTTYEEWMRVIEGVEKEQMEC
ncbi:GspE/PulE family protein [Laceyella tengchongensis]|uniref:GspE/PulE family protein n=1 Tax=Laceyella tengchongensis TaxID=574699 RepID=UPI00188EF39A